MEKNDQQPAHICNCGGCREERKKQRDQAAADALALQMQLDHPFYKRVEEFRDMIKAETMAKAAKKYKEPFNPRSWTLPQLAKHAMAENYDQANYIMGLYEKAEEIEKAMVSLAHASAARIAELEKELAHANHEAEFWRQRAIKAAKPGIDPKQLKNEMDKLHGEVKGAILDVKG